MQWKKPVISPAVYTTPDGVQVVDRARLERWRDWINDRVKEGHKPPVSWGHHSQALPAGDDDAAYWASRFVAGKVTGAELDAAGQLVIHGDTPGVDVDAQGRLVTRVTLPDGRQVTSAIEEVSIGARDWTDGSGRQHRDAPIHLALTPLPVWVPEGGQPPFEAAQATPGLAQFSTSRVLYRFGSEPMADKPDDKPDKKGDKKDDGAVAGGATIKEALEVLAKVGLTLPDDTTPENLLERLVVAGTAIAATTGDDTDTPPVTEEPGGTTGAAFMSTIANDPTVQALLARVEADDRTRRLNRITALANRGLPAARAKALRERASQARFSIGTDHKPVPQMIDELLDELEASLPREGSYSQLFASTAQGLVEAVPPEAASDPAARAAQVAEEQARNSGLPARKKGA